MSEHGYLAIADISGYTRFLTGSELEHAQGVLENLYSVILGRLHDPFSLSNIQGDAFFAYAPDQAISSAGQIMDTLEALYIGFRERLSYIVDNTSCPCRACANAADLDLKFVVHHGEYAVQDIAGRHELTGSDVILLHRLLKNDVVPETKISGYALFTMAAVNTLDLNELRDDAEPYVANLEEFGSIECRVADFGACWQRHRSISEIVVGDEELWFDPVSEHIPASVEMVWEAECNPAIFTRWNTVFTNHRRLIGSASRLQVGAVDHCEHGKDVVALHYIDVRPQKHFTQEMPLPLNGKIRWTKTFAAENGGTRINARVARPESSNILTDLLLRGFSYLFMRKSVGGIFERECELLRDYFESGSFLESQSS